MTLRFFGLSLLGAAAAFAQAEATVRAAVDALRDASGYSWETTARQNATEYDDFAKATTRLEDQPRVVEVRGKTARDGLTEITLPPLRGGVPVPVTAFIQSSVEALARTPFGWMTRQEMRDSPRAGETVEIDGKRVHLQRFFAVARQATNVDAPHNVLRGLIADVDEFEEDGDTIVGRLHPGATAILREGGRRSAGTTGELVGKVVFRIREGVVEEYEVRFETEVPRVDRTPIRRVERWVTTLSGIGETVVDPPEEVLAKFDAMDEAP